MYSLARVDNCSVVLTADVFYKCSVVLTADVFDKCSVVLNKCGAVLTAHVLKSVVLYLLPMC